MMSRCCATTVTGVDYRTRAPESGLISASAMIIVPPVLQFHLL